MLNKYSKTVTQDSSQPAAQAMLHAIGLSEDDLKKPFVGIPKEILEKYKNDIQSISDQEVEEIVDKFLNK